MRVGVSIGDSIAGIYAAFGTVMALLHREPGRTCRWPIASSTSPSTKSVLSVMESLVPDHLAYGVTRERVGGRMEGIAPSNAYPCSDGASIIVAGNGDGIFGRYMRVIGRDDLADDPDLQTNAGRWRRRDELDDAIADWTRDTPATRRSRSSTTRACPADRSTTPPTSAPTNSTRRAT